MNDEKKYLVQVDDEAELWDSSKMDRNIDALYADFQDADVFELDAYNPDDALDSDQYLVNLDDETEVWDADKWNRNREALMADFPEAKVQRVRYKDYWGEKATATQERINELEQPDEERNARLAEIGYFDDSLGEANLEVGLKPLSEAIHESATGETTYLDPKVEEFFANDSAYTARLNEIAKLKDEYNANPSVIRQREYEAEAAKYAAESLNRLEEQTLANRKSEVDQYHAAQGAAAKHQYDPYGSNQAVQAIRMMKGEDVGKDVAENEKLEKYDSALKLIQQTKDIYDAVGRGFGAGFADTAQDWLRNAATQSDIEMYNEVGDILSALQDKIGNLNNITEEDIENNLSKEDQALIKAFYEYNHAMASAGKDLSGWYKGGKIFAESIPFMLEFLATGGLSKAAEVGATSALRMAFNRWIRKSAKGTAARIAKQAAKRVAVGGVKLLAGGGVRTLAAPSTYRNMAEKSVEIDEKTGELHRAKNAFVGAVDSYIEQMSEMSGTYFKSIFGGLTKDLGIKALGKVKFDEIGKWFADSATMQKLAKLGFHGLPEEIGEEVFGNALRTLSGVDDEALSRMFEPDELGAMLIGFAPMTLFGAGVSAARMGYVNIAAANAAKRMREDAGRHFEAKQLDEVEALVESCKDANEIAQAVKPVIAGMKTMGASKYEIQSVIDYARAVANKRVMGFAAKAQEMQLSDAKIKETEEQLGNPFWMENKEGGKDVKTVVLNNGKTVFVTSQPDADGRVTYIESGTGKKGMALPSDIKKETWFGSLNAYGAGLVMSERNEREKQRFLEERSKQIGALREKLAVDPKINVGTQGSPIYLVAQSFNDAGVRYVDQNGSTGNLSWEQVGNALGSPIVVESDAQIAYREAEAMVEAAAKRRAEKAKNDELGQAEAASANTDALNAANAIAETEVNIPKNDDGSVNEVAFWEQDPEGYVKWNDERNKDGGKDSLEQIAVTRDELMVLLSQAQDAQKTSNPVTRKAAKADAEMLAEKIARLDAIEQSYMNALEAEKENVKKTNATPTASMNEEQRENMDTQYQNILGKTRVKTEKVRVMQEYLDKISEGSLPAILMTKEDYVEKMKANGASEVAIEKVRQAVNNGKVAGLMNRGKVYLMMDGLATIDAGRVTYVHERQHAFNEADIKYIKAVVNAVKGGKAGMMKILEAMVGKVPAKVYKGLSVRAIADEIICRSMEIVYSNENYSVALQELGVPAEVISIITEIDNEQRNVLNLSHARRRGRLDKHDDRGGRGSNQQDVGNLGQISGGVLGEQGAGSSGVGETGARDGESGDEPGGLGEDNAPLRVVEPEDNLTEATKEELAEKGLVMDGGAIMSDDYAALKNETGYLTPIERDTDVDSVKFSHVTMPGWKKNYLTYQDAEKRVIQYLEAFADRITANELVNGVVAQGQHKSSKKTKDGKLVEAGPLRSNISYVVTFDLDTTCPRTFQYLNYVRRIESRIGRPLTQIECIQLNEMMRMYGQQIPCVYCYAENKRQAMKQYFNNYIAARHAVLSAETDEEALKHMYGREKEGDNPKAVLTEAAYKVFKKWRSNPKGFYNPTMKVLWYQYNQARNSVLTLLDMKYADGSVKTSSADDTIADAIALELGVTNKTAVRAIEEIVAEWKWNTIEEKPHDDFTPVDEDDIWANQNALEVWRDMTLYAKSASGAKNVNRYVPYTDELKHVDQATRDYINGMGGVRMHSTNDFRIDYVFDYFQFMADMAANKMLGHTYTKSPEFVRIFGNSGYKINMSIAAYQDENGNIRPNVDEGFDWEEAKMLRQYFGNAGTMLMATSDEQLQMALDSDWIDMCIPFHHSGLPKSVWYNMRLWTDYTTTQNERYFNTEEKIAMLKEGGVELPKKSSKVSSEDYTNWVEETFNEHFNITVRYGKDGKRVKPHFLPGPTIVNGVNIPGHNNDHQLYLDLCRQWGVKPRFEGIKVKDNTPEGGGRIVDITQHPRYMILVKETARTDTPQTPIMFNFDEPSEALGGKTPLDYAFEELEARAMSESELAGEQVRDIYTSLKKDQFGIVDQFLNTIIRHKEETGEEYPMDYLTPESREWFMVQRKALEEAFKDMDYIPYHRNEYDEQGNLISGPGLEREEPESIMAAAKEVAEKQPKKAKKPGKKSKKADDVMLRTADQPAESMRVQPHESSLYEIEYYFNALNSKPELVPLFEKVKNICDLLGTDFKFVSEKEMAALEGKKSSTAEGIAWGNKIRINADAWNNTSNQSSAETILHEMIHVCTSYMLWAEEDSLPENVLAAKREIESIYDVVKDKYRSYYAATNSHEMLAEMSNPWFRVSLKKGNLWERFINMNRVLLGFEPKDNNRFDAVDAALNTILDNPDFSLFYEMEPDSEEYVAFSFVPRTEEQREQLFDKARAKYGVTSNFNATGYMLPDGSLLDFSEANDGGDPNRRSLDHRDIEGIIMDEGREYESRFDYVADFVDEGAIRMLPEYAGFQLAVKPTQEQRGKLMDYIYKHNGEVIMEITDESGRNDFYREYDRRTSPARIFRDMDNYFNNGDVPGGDDRVSFRVLDTTKAELKDKPIKLNGIRRFKLKSAFKGVKGAEGYYPYTTVQIEEVEDDFTGHRMVFESINEGYVVIYAPKGTVEMEDNHLYADPKKIETELWDALKSAENYFEAKLGGGPWAKFEDGYRDWVNVGSDDVRFSIIGERGAQNDKTQEGLERLNNLEVARQMESQLNPDWSAKNDENALKIKVATGWERGADGKWRYEVEDLAMRPESEWMDSKKKLALRDIVEPNPIFDMYPDLLDIKIVKDRSKYSLGAWYNHKKNEMKLPFGALKDDADFARDFGFSPRENHSFLRTLKKMETNILHEVQHAIQDREGFAQGGNSNMLMPEDKAKYIALVKEYNALAEEYNAILEKEGYSQAAKEKSAEADRKSAEADRYLKNHRIGESGYKRLSGEVEANNVEKRHEMSLNERRNSLLAATEDVARKDQIFIMEAVAEEQSSVRFRIANENQAIFVSNAAKAVEGIKMEKATPEQWLKMIEKNGGLKAGEDKWMGLSDWLKASDKKTLTKDEVMQFVNENMIRIEEQHYADFDADEVGDAMADNIQAKYGKQFADDFYKAFAFEEDSFYNKWYIAIFDEDLALKLYNEANNASITVGEYGLEIDDADTIKEWATSIAKEAEEVKGVREINSMRKGYTTRSLVNLREIALTVPTIEPWNVNDNTHFGDAGEGRAVAWIRFGETKVYATTKEGAEYKAFADNMLQRYHIDEEVELNRFGTIVVPQELLDALTDEQMNELQRLKAASMSASGNTEKSVLVIDEIQSKRHQEGREHGYKSPRPTKETERLKALNAKMSELREQQSKINEEIAREVEKEDVELARIETMLDEAMNIRQYDELTKMREDIRRKRSTREDAIYVIKNEIMLTQSAIWDEEGEISRAEIQWIDDNKGKVADAPFDKNWHELAMKRMLRYAAENGYDAIAWTKGEQQAERYSLTKYFNGIAREDNPSVDGKRFQLYGGNVETLIVNNEGKVIDSTIEEAKGKSLSEVVGKEVADKMMTIEDGDSLADADIAVGGEGMKGFYDKMLPAFMNKYGKKWGVKVEDIDLPNLGKDGLTMHSVPVTEEMKESVMEGQVMFRTADITPEVAAEMKEIKERAEADGTFSEENDDVRFKVVTDSALIDKLDNEELIPLYRAMQLVDGKLYPPMAGKTAKELGGIKDWGDPTPEGVWLQSDEMPWLAKKARYDKDSKDGKHKKGDYKYNEDGSHKWVFELDKGNGKTLYAAYNPYIHTSFSPLNDQFSEAQDRDNIVIVRVLVPKSELTSGYKAEKAKDSVGMQPWHKGPISGVLAQYEGKGREVMLTRYAKIDRILSNAEVADVALEIMQGTTLMNNPLPTNVFTPGVRAELEKRGFEFVETTNKGNIKEGEHKGKTWASVYGKDNLGKKPKDEVMFSMAQAVDHKALREISSLRSFRFGFNELQKAIGSTVAGEEQVVNSLRAKKNPTAYDKERLRRAELDLAAARKAMQWWESVNERLVDDARVEPDYKAALQDMEPRNTFEFLSVFFTMQTARVSKMFVDDEGKGVMKKVNEKTGIMLSPETLRQELGWSTGDWAKMKYIVSASKGRSLDEIAEMISEDADAQTFFYGMDTMEIKDEVIDFLQSMESYAAIRDYIKTQREREAREIADDINARIGVVVDEIEQSGMTIEEYNAAVIDEAYKEVEEQLEMLDQSEIYGNFENLTDEEYERYLEAVIRGEEGRTSESTEDLPESEDASEDISEEAEGESSAGASGGNRNDSGNVGNRPGEAGEYAGPALGDKKQGVVSPSGAIDTEGLSVDEIVEKGTMKAAEANAEAAGTYLEKVRKINDGLASIRTALAAQKSYDRATVKIVTDLANSLLEGGRLADLTRGEIKRTISVVKSANGKEDLSIEVDRLLDIMVANQLRNGRERVEQLMKVKATKVNATGVEVRGSMDIAGQQMMDAFKKGIAPSMTDQMLSDKIAEAENDLSSESEVLRRNAENELAGYYLAREYRENILASISEEELLRDLIKDAKKQYDAGAADKRSYKEYIASCYDAIRDNRMQRVAAYENMAAVLAGKIADSVMNAKLLNAREQARIENIHHMANSDMQGMPSVQQGKVRSKFWNSSIIRFLFKPLVTFDQMLRSFAPKSRYGEGYLWNHFMGGWLKASENEYKGVQAAHETLDARAKALFGVQRWSNLFKVIKKLPKMTVEFWDGEKMADFELTQGNLLYIYMVNKMVDGQMKLRKMGITEEDVDKIARNLDPRLIELADWVQDSFLPLQREKYNAVHERLFGAPMAAIDNYFPIRVLANARTREVDIAVEETNSKPATTTGGIIKRTRNSLALDVLGSDVIDVVLEHIQEMEHWAAFAEFNKDLNTLLSYNKFRNRVQNMLGIYGAGETVWNNFRSAAEIAAGVYKPAVKGDSIDKLITNVAKGVTGAKISFRVYTAIKQILSAPAFVSDASMASLLKNVANPAKAWNWAMDNLPLFEKRWKSRQAGDSRLMETEADWELWTTKLVELAGRVGMTPNAFVDAVTVSLGAKAIYDTKLQEYLDYGYSQERAEEKAKRDATVLFNESQQSNESAFLSPAQVDRTVASILITVFRNSSMGYQRMYVDALRNIKHMMKKGYKAESLEYMTKQMVRDGLTPEQAERAAERIYNRSFARNAARVATFGFLVQFAWNLGPYMVYLLMGDDDEEKKDMIVDAAVRGLVGGPVEGLAAGQAISSLLGDIAMGEKPSDPTIKLPATSDIESLFKTLEHDSVRAVNDIVNLLVQSGIGVNPQTLTDAVVAIVDASNGDLGLAKETAFALMRVLQTPQSQIEKLYLDEIGFTEDEVYDMTVKEFAERYAKYKVMRNAPLTKWMYSDEREKELEDKYIKQFAQKAKDIRKERGSEEAQAWYGYIEGEYEESKQKIKDLNEAIKDGSKEAAKELSGFHRTPEGQRYYKAKEIEGYTKSLEELEGRHKESLNDKRKEAFGELMQMLEQQ